MFFASIIRNRQLLFAVTELKDIPSLLFAFERIYHSLLHCQRQDYVLCALTGKPLPTLSVAARKPANRKSFFFFFFNEAWKNKYYLEKKKKRVFKNRNRIGAEIIILDNKRPVHTCQDCGQQNHLCVPPRRPVNLFYPLFALSSYNSGKTC